jgi:hypothetical protein
MYAAPVDTSPTSVGADGPARLTVSGLVTVDAGESSAGVSATQATAKQPRIAEHAIHLIDA